MNRSDFLKRAPSSGAGIIDIREQLLVNNELCVKSPK